MGVVLFNKGAAQGHGLEAIALDGPLLGARRQLGLGAVAEGEDLVKPRTSAGKADPGHGPRGNKAKQEGETKGQGAAGGSGKHGNLLYPMDHARIVQLCPNQQNPMIIIV